MENQKVLKEVEKSDGQIIMFIDELHTVVGAGSTEGSMDAGNLLKPMLARGELRTIGATTINEYRKYIEKDPALERRFQPVLVDEPSVEDTISILRGLKEKYEVHHGIRILDSALIQAAKLSDRYITDRFLPDKAIDVLDEACSRVRLRGYKVPDTIENMEELRDAVLAVQDTRCSAFTSDNSLELKKGEENLELLPDFKQIMEERYKGSFLPTEY